MRPWPQEGWETLVIAADSEYVVRGATQYCHAWLRNGWKTSSGGDVVNQDLWGSVLESIAEFRENGLEVQFWHIPRGLNSVADRLAKDGAQSSPVGYYREVCLDA